MENRIRFYRDEYPTSPRDWDNLGIMACWHRRYDLGDEQPSESSQEWIDALPEGTIIEPLYLYDHSGITMSTTPFHCPWDSGQVGVIVATPEAVKAAFGENATHERVVEALRQEVENYDTFLRGNVFGYVIEEREECDECHNVDWNVVDSCGGFFAEALEESGVLSHIDEDMHAAAKEAWDEFAS